MRLIPLTKGQVALVDDEDYSYISKFKWHFQNSGYAARRGRKGEQTMVFLHHQVYGKPKDGLQIDHINCNRLDNRKCNLRIVTRTQNCANRSKSCIKTSSQYKGVYLDKKANRWRSVIEIDGKKKTIGRFLNEQDAAIAYNNAAIKYFGEYARLNQIK